MRIAVYARVSTSDQTVDLQLHALREYTQRRGAQTVEYVDHGVSGRKDSRLALDQLMAAARRREVDAVVVTKLDRLIVAGPRQELSEVGATPSLLVA